MTRKRPPRQRPHAAPAHAPRTAARPAPAWLTPALVFGVPALAALWVHRGALGAFFTTDDLILLERASGQAPFPATLWRFLPGQAYFRLLWPVFGANAPGWHVVGWLLHGLATALVAAWALRLGARRTVAALAALLFGTAARARTVAWQVTGVGQELGTVFALLALVALADAAPRLRRSALAWHVAALLSLESTALAPLAAPAGSASAGERRLRLREVGIALGLSAAMGLYVVLARGSTGSLGGEAYALGFGAHVVQHLFNYTIWSVDFLHLSNLVSIPPPPAWAGFAIAVLAGLAWIALRGGSRPLRAGLVLWIATLLPVLPLVNAVYEHYLYLPRAGFSLAVAAIVAGGPRRRAAYALAGFLAAVHLLTATMYLNAMRHVQVAQVQLPRDSFLRRMAVIRNAAESVRGRFTEPVTLVVYTPPGALQSFDTRTGAPVQDPSRYRFRSNLVQSSLDDGRGLRVFAPSLREVRFTEQPSEADRGQELATNLGDGRLEFHGRAPQAHEVMAAFWETHGHPEAAAGHRAAVARLDSLAAARRLDATAGAVKMPPPRP